MSVRRSVAVRGGNAYILEDLVYLRVAILEVLCKELQVKSVYRFSATLHGESGTFCWLSALAELTALLATFTVAKAPRGKAVRATTPERAANLKDMTIL